MVDINSTRCDVMFVPTAQTIAILCCAFQIRKFRLADDLPIRSFVSVRKGLPTLGAIATQYSVFLPRIQRKTKLSRRHESGGKESANYAGRAALVAT